MTFDNKSPAAAKIEAWFNRSTMTAGLLVAIGFWCLEAAMNFKFGAKEAHPAIGLILVGIAVYAAMLCIKMCAVRGTGWEANLQRLKSGIPWAVCFFICQVAGWNVLGTTLADGSATRSNKAKAQEIAGESLEGKRARRAKMGDVRAVREIQADIDAALNKVLKTGQTIRDASQACANPAVAPSTCRTVDGLKKELVKSEEAAALDGELSGGAAKLGDTQAVTEGNWHLKVLGRASGADGKEVGFWGVLLLTLAVGAISNFGFVACGIGQGGAPGPGGGGIAKPGGSGPRPVDHDDLFADWPHMRPWAPAGRALPSPSAYAAQDQNGGPQSPASYAAPHFASHGAPININLSTGAGPVPPASSGQAPAAASSSPDPRQPGPSSHAALPATLVPPAPAAGRYDLAAMPADAPPVDRSRLTRPVAPEARQPVDVALAFQAACLVDAPGSLVVLDDLYRRYRAWVGERAVARDAFGVIAETIGIGLVRIGETVHARDVAIKAGPALSTVSATAAA